MKIVNLLPDHYIEHEYFNEMFSYFDPEVFKDITFYVSFDYRKLPEYGKNVVAILTAGDERGRPPVYASMVGLVFKHHLDVDKIGNVYHIPLPYVNKFSGNSDIPIEKRKYDVFFVGRHSCRMDMVNELRKLQAERKDLKFCVYVTGHKFMKGWPIQQYSSEMSNSKIVISPKGAVRAECIRFTEAVKCGCAIVACRHPDVRVFRGCPATYLHNGWQELGPAIDKILRGGQLNNIHTKMKKCWDDYFCPKSVALYINKIGRNVYGH